MPTSNMMPDRYRYDLSIDHDDDEPWFYHCSLRSALMPVIGDGDGCDPTSDFGIQQGDADDDIWHRFASTITD